MKMIKLLTSAFATTFVFVGVPMSAVGKHHHLHHDHDHMYVLSVTTMLAMVFVVATGFGIREDGMSVVWNTELNPEELLSCLMES